MLGCGIIFFVNKKEIEKILKDKKAFPHRVRYLKLKETYISWLIFTGGVVYKIKRPVQFSYLDFSTLKKRKFFLAQELKLNQRLAREIYLDVVPIAVNNNKIRILEKSDSPLLKDERIKDYALKMKEIPQRYYAPFLLEKGCLKKEALAKLAKIIADFHEKAETSKEIEKYGGLKIIRKNWEENFKQTKPFAGKLINKAIFLFIKKEIRRFLKENRTLFEKRIREKKIRDCHGDFHTGNIFIGPKKIFVIDCLEFNKRFRYQDTAADAAFLAMDLEYLKRPDLSDYFVKKYAARSKDKDLLKILPFYKCYRAYVRAKVGCFSLPKADILSIKRYFSLSFKYAFSLKNRRPFLLIICGQIGTGKTHLAEYLSLITGAYLLRSDVLRKKMLGIPLFSRPKKNIKEIYGEKTTEKIYKKMYSEGLKWIKNGRPVILDATFSREKYRKKIREAAERSGVPYLFVKCYAPEKEILARLKQRAKKKEISDATIEVYLKRKQEFEKIKLKKRFLRLNTQGDNVEQKANRVLKKLLSLDAKRI